LFHFLSVVCHCRLRGPNDRHPPDAAFPGNARHLRVTRALSGLIESERGFP
jgi:hypothetical protein